MTKNKQENRVCKHYAPANQECACNNEPGDYGECVYDDGIVAGELSCKFYENERKNTKIKVTSVEIVVHGTVDKPLYEIKYFDVVDGECHIGYSSYDLNYVFEWLKECFEIVNHMNN